MGFLHRFEQRTLRLRRRAVDFIDQHDLREQRTGVENKALLLAIVNRIANDVRRQQIAGELNPPEVESQRACERMRQRRLADTRKILDQQVAAREQALRPRGERHLPCRR